MSAYPAGYIEQLARPLRARRPRTDERAHTHHGPHGEQRAGDPLEQDRDAGRLGSGAGTGAQAKRR